MAGPASAEEEADPPAGTTEAAVSEEPTSVETSESAAPPEQEAVSDPDPEPASDPEPAEPAPAENVVDPAAQEAAVDEAPVEKMASDPAEPVLDEVFGDVDVTWNEGGPDFDNPWDEMASSLSGTRDGDEAVLYRIDTTNGPETWVWDGRHQEWGYVPGATQPGTRYFQAGAGLPLDSDDLALIYGGWGGSESGPNFADTWLLGPDYQWYQSCNPCAPGTLTGASATNSEWETFLFGGYTGTAMSPDLWIWNDVLGDWDLVVPLGPAAPAGRVGAGFAYDGRDFILFGGADDNLLPFGDTWRLYYTGGSWWWELVVTPVAPSSRAFPAFAGLYWRDDPWPGAVLVGGYDFTDKGSISAYALTDTWAWDGENWILADAGFGSFPIDFDDPSTAVDGVPYSPKAAAMPAIGAMVWTAANCLPATEEWDCARMTHQINLPAKGVELAAGLPFTGLGRLDGMVALALLLLTLGATARVAGRKH